MENYSIKLGEATFFRSQRSSSFRISRESLVNVKLFGRAPWESALIWETLSNSTFIQHSSICFPRSNPLHVQTFLSLVRSDSDNLMGVYFLSTRFYNLMDGDGQCSVAAIWNLQTCTWGSSVVWLGKFSEEQACCIRNVSLCSGLNNGRRKY